MDGKVGVALDGYNLPTGRGVKASCVIDATRSVDSSWAFRNGFARSNERSWLSYRIVLEIVTNPTDVSKLVELFTNVELAWIQLANSHISITKSLRLFSSSSLISARSASSKPAPLL